MNRAEHHAAAERLLADSLEVDGLTPSEHMTVMGTLVQRALVHATLASGVLAEGEPAPQPRDQVTELMVELDEKARRLNDQTDEISDLRVSLENAEQSRRLAEGLLRTARGKRDDLQDRIERALSAISAVNPMTGSPMGRVQTILEGPPRAERVLPPGYRPQYTAGEQSGLTWKDCTLDGVPIPNTDGTPNKYAHHTLCLDPGWHTPSLTPCALPSDGPGQ